MKLVKKMSKGWLVAISLIALMSIGSGSSLIGAQSQPVYGGSLIVAMAAEPPGLDPRISTAAAIARIVYNNVLEGLVKIDRNGNIIPAIAESLPEISADGLEYTFRLRQNVKFHNGRGLTAADVKWTLDQARDPKGVYAHKEYYTTLADVVVVDDFTVKLKLSTVDADLLFNLARADSAIVPQEAAADLKSNPVGTGPFKFVEWARGDHVTLEKFTDYHQPGLPYLDKVVFKFIPDPAAAVTALKAGDIDVIGYPGPSPEAVIALKEDPKLKVLEGLTTTDVILAMNNSRTPFNKLEIRRAISYAINREEIIRGAMFGFGVPIGSHMSPIEPLYCDMTWMYPYDPSKAKELLKEAGYPDGFKATLRLPAPYDYARRSGEVIAAELERVGINLTLEVIDWGRWLSEVFKEANYDLTIIGHAEPFDIGIYALPTYYFRYNNPQIQELINQARATTDLAKRKQIYCDIQRIIAEDAVNGFLFNLPLLQAMKKDVQNMWKDAPIHAIDVTEVYRAK